MKKFDVLAAILLVVGGLNWGLVALAKFDLVAFLTGAGQFGAVNPLGVVVYALVGLSAIYQALSWKAIQRRWTQAMVAAAVAAVAFLGFANPSLADSCGSAKAGSVQATAASTANEANPAAAGTVVDVAIKAGAFQTLVAAIKAAGLEETLQGKGPFTVFAPTDEAFAKLPKGTVEALLQDKAKLAQILTYHVVSGRVMAADVVKLTEATTVQGQKIRIAASKDGVKVNDARVTTTDVAASNGVIHIIDTVILPS